MVLSTPAPHAPFTPAPKYKDRFPYEKAPRYEICQKIIIIYKKKNLFFPSRTPAFNYVEADPYRKHWFINTNPRPLSNKIIKVIQSF